MNLNLFLHKWLYSLCIFTIVSFWFILNALLVSILFCKCILPYFFGFFPPISSLRSLSSYHHCCFMYVNTEGFSPYMPLEGKPHSQCFPLIYRHDQSRGWQLVHLKAAPQPLLTLLHWKATAVDIFSFPEVKVTETTEVYSCHKKAFLLFLLSWGTMCSFLLRRVHYQGQVR